MGPQPTPPPACYLLVATLQKKMNIGMSIRSAVAMGVSEVLVAGPRDVSTFGDQGTLRHARLRQFDRLREAVAWLRGRGVSVCGIEICAGARAVQEHPFRGPTAFLAGSEGDGLADAHKALCDHFVYVPQHGNGTASLNVTVATSIVLHHFAVWARFPETPRDDAGRDKFLVVPPPQKRGAAGEEDLAKRAERQRARGGTLGGGVEEGLGAGEGDGPGDGRGEDATGT